jgi:uncharacterized protein YcfL
MKKRLLCMSLAAIMVLSVGCSEKQKTEEEIRAEVKAELEAEAALKEELKAEIVAEMAEEAAAGTDEEAEVPSSGESAKTETSSHEETAVTYEDDEFVISYARPNLEGVDQSKFDQVTVDARDVSKSAQMDGNTYTYQMAFEGPVDDVEIYYTRYAYEDAGLEVKTFDHLEDTIITIESNKLMDFTGYFVHFKDGRGSGGRFYFGDDMVQENVTVELKWGFTGEEKTPSPYEAYDLSMFSEIIGMTTADFEASSWMDDCESFKGDGMDYGFTEYVMGRKIDGLELRFFASEEDNIISSCHIMKNDAYLSAGEDQKFSYAGVDFDMTPARAFKQLKDSQLNIGFYGEDESSIIEMYIMK